MYGVNSRQSFVNWREENVSALQWEQLGCVGFVVFFFFNIGSEHGLGRIEVIWHLHLGLKQLFQSANTLCDKQSTSSLICAILSF